MLTWKPRRCSGPPLQVDKSKMLEMFSREGEKVAFEKPVEVRKLAPPLC